MMLLEMIVAFFSRPQFQGLFFLITKLGLAGMNYGLSGSVRGSGESEVISLIERRGSIKKNLIVFDLGANIGDYTDSVLKVLSKKSKVYAFEPSRDALEQLHSRFARESRVTIVPFACSEKSGTAILFADKAASGFASLYQRDLSHIGVTMKKQEKIRLTTLDDYCKKRGISHIDILKMDIEGHEYAALLGARNLLANKKIDVIQFEFGGCNIDSRTYFHDYFTLLSPSYDLYRVLQHGFTRISTYSEMLEVFVNSNIIAIRKGSGISV